jgi:hypothetical protein
VFFSKKPKQNYRVIAVLEELDDVSGMLKDYFEEYGYKSGIVSKLEVNITSEIVILQIDPNNVIDLKNVKLEAIVVNLKNPLVYKKEIWQLAKKLEKTGAIIGEHMAMEKLEKKLPKNVLVAKIDYTSEEENRSVHEYKYVAFYAESLTKSLYRYTDNVKNADKSWKINNKYAYKLEALLFATVNSCGLVN